MKEFFKICGAALVIWIGLDIIIDLILLIIGNLV